jgi:Tfp pilus assembly protein PilZ
MQLAIKEKAALYAAYIPLFAEGGILCPRSVTIVWAMMSMCC